MAEVQQSKTAVSTRLFEREGEVTLFNQIRFFGQNRGTGCSSMTFRQKLFIDFMDETRVFGLDATLKHEMKMLRCLKEN